MLKASALAYFKSDSRRLAQVIDVSVPAVFRWGPVIPYFSAVHLERVTGAALKLRPELYHRGRPLKGQRLIDALRAVQLPRSYKLERQQFAAVMRSLRAELRAEATLTASVVDHE